jgi:hypothetical protein
MIRLVGCYKSLQKEREKVEATKRMSPKHKLK